VDKTSRHATSKVCQHHCGDPRGLVLSDEPITDHAVVIDSTEGWRVHTVAEERSRDDAQHPAHDVAWDRALVA